MKKKIYFKPNAKVRQLVIDGAPLLAASGEGKQQINAGNAAGGGVTNDETPWAKGQDFDAEDEDETNTPYGF